MENYSDIESLLSNLTPSSVGRGQVTSYFMAWTTKILTDIEHKATIKSRGGKLADDFSGVK